jgi:hypothetical protein
MNGSDGRKKTQGGFEHNKKETLAAVMSFILAIRASAQRVIT